jgi:hypothetical protein
MPNYAPCRANARLDSALPILINAPPRLRICEGAEASKRELGDPRHFPLLSDVGDHAGDLTAIQPDGIGNTSQPVRATRRQHDTRAAFRNEPGGRDTDAAGGTGDHQRLDRLKMRLVSAPWCLRAAAMRARLGSDYPLRCPGDPAAALPIAG